MQPILWHALSVSEVLERLEADEKRGLTQKETYRREAQFGRNEIEAQERDTLLRRTLRQFKSVLVLILLTALVATTLLGEYLDAIVIGVALATSVILGIIQEGRASRAFDTLVNSVKTKTTVVRGGKQHVIDAEDVVVGDTVVLEPGSAVPADLRIVSAKNLATNEAALTGEWASVSKGVDAVAGETAIVERRNMAFKGTLVVSGIGRGIVTAVGEDTEFGKIAAQLDIEDSRDTTLTRNVRAIGRFLVVIIAVAVFAIFLLGLLRGEPFVEMLTISIAIAVAAVPAGLPAAVTIVLAIGMEAILNRGGLVRNLLAAETLGSTTIILTDKTGTLTQASMRLASLHTLKGMGAKDESLEVPDNARLLEMAVYTSGAYIDEVQNGERKYIVRGDPVEKAVLEAGLDAGIVQENPANERIDFLPFESERRLAVSLNTIGGTRRLYFNGAPEALLERSAYVFEGGESRAMQDADRAAFRKRQEALSREGLRFIAVAFRNTKLAEIPENLRDENGERVDQKLVFAGLLAFEDPLRGGVPDSMRLVQDAGVTVHIVTGDHKETARSIALSTGVRGAEAEPLTGTDLESMNDTELLEALQSHAVFARVLPEQKLRIVNVLRAAGEIVAMTGDGINDAPALRSAHIGVAVGSGTEVAKEASDLVLLNDSFSIIVDAIAEGRRIIDNLRKIIAYLLSTSFSEIVLIGGALIFGAPLPLLATQILWANIVEEGLMSFAYAFEPRSKATMRRKPDALSSTTILMKDTKILIGIITAVTGLLLLGLFWYLLSLDLPIEEVRTVMFVALSLDSIFFAFSFKSLDTPIWRMNLASNQYLLLALGVSVAALLAALVLDPLQKLLTLTTLNLFEIVLLAGFGLFNLFVIEVAKWALFERKR